MARKLSSTIAALVLSAFATAAFAQKTDLDWTGFYAGVYIGAAVPHLDITDVGVSGQTFAARGTAGQVFQANDAALLEGGRLGWDSQTGQFVYGAVADLGWLDLHGGALDPGTSSNTQAGLNSGFHTNFGGRFGVAHRSALFYAKAGASFFSGKELFSTQANVPTHADTGTFKGYAVGAGVEYRLNQGWSASGEYLHSGYGQQIFNEGIYPFDEKLSLNTFTVGVNYRFNLHRASNAKH